MFTHTCIKRDCRSMYQSEEPDAYLCPPCLMAKQQIAAELDGRFNTKGQKPNDMFAGSKELKMADGRVANFFKA